MLCLTCHHPTPDALCAQCAGSLRRAPERVLPGGIRVVSCFSHEGVARDLVHLLKYRSVPIVAEVMANELPDRLPGLPLVPVPRVLSRRIRYGVDPAVELARGIGRRTGDVVLQVLRSPIHVPRRAGHNDKRPVARYARRLAPQGRVVLVDDVVTTGATLLAAASAIGAHNVEMAVCATSTPGVSSLPVA